MPPIILLHILLLPLVASQYSETVFNVNHIVFTTGHPFISYFNVTGTGVSLQLECHMSTGGSFVAGNILTTTAVNTDQTASFGDLSFTFPNPASWLSLTCSVKMRIFDNNDNAVNVVDYSLLYESSSANNPNPSNSIVARFSLNADWTLTATADKHCSDVNAEGYDCDENCVTCYNGRSVCCEGDNYDLTYCTCTATPSTASPWNTQPTESPHCIDAENNESLYFWCMIGLAALSALLLLLLIITMCYVCCALYKQDQKPVIVEAPRPPPPVYLGTPPRDARYGYRGPPPRDVYEDDSFDDTWQETRTEARV